MHDFCVEGEKLDLLIGSRPLAEAGDLDEKEKEAVKKNMLELLEKYYGMEEEDFVSAELEIVPAGKARDCGLDRSMVLAYGQDDRVCAFTSLFAMLDVAEVERTACCILVDKEEIGSVGATGMHSRFFENVVAELVALTGGESELKVIHHLGINLVNIRHFQFLLLAHDFYFLAPAINPAKVCLHRYILEIITI